jgi:TonB family protein
MKSVLVIALLTGLTAQAQVTNKWLTRPAALLKFPIAALHAEHETEVTFFCDVSKDGKASDFLLYRPADPSNAFVVAVRKALDAATFEPAVSQGQPVVVQIAATVSFGDSAPVVRLNASDKSASERDYSGPQLIGGHLALLQSVAYPAIARAQHVNGLADVAFEIDTFGNPRGVHAVNEQPPGHGFGESAVAALRKARFIPASYNSQSLKAPATERIEFNLQVIERYAPKTK